MSKESRYRHTQVFKKGKKEVKFFQSLEHSCTWNSFGKVTNRFNNNLNKMAPYFTGMHRRYKCIVYGKRAHSIACAVKVINTPYSGTSLKRPLSLKC